MKGKMKMEIGVFVLLAVSYIHLVLASPSTVPAFLWSPHLQSANGELEENVNYQIMSPKDLANSVLSQGGWSNFLCTREELQHPIDLALVFVGRKLLSSDVSLKRNTDPALLDLLEGFYATSNFSVAFPYIANHGEERMENLLVSGFKEACGHTLGVSNIVFSESCSVQDGSVQKLANLQLIHDHLLSRRETRKKGEADLVVFCSENSRSSSELEEPRSEGEIISELISSVEQSGTKYAGLYVSDPSWYSSYQTLQRFLAESAAGNGSDNATTGCDEVCRLKSSLLEGVLVGVVLLLILISGLCCMAGIDTPSRFETPQDS